MEPTEEKIYISLGVPVFVSTSGIAKKSLVAEHLKIFVSDIEQFHYPLIVIYPVFMGVILRLSLFFEYKEYSIKNISIC